MVFNVPSSPGPLGVPPRQVILFSGHLIDRLGRTPPRFPPARAAAAALRVAAELERLDAGPDDLALSQAAAGGDLLFLDACLARRVPVQVLLPFDEARFVQESVQPVADGEAWVQRYAKVRARLPEAPQVLVHEPGVDPGRGNPFERCNDWLLASALAWGADRLRVICLWDGATAALPGGTARMVEAVRRHGVEPRVIDTRTL
jgi:hypothetical protein